MTVSVIVDYTTYHKNLVVLLWFG